MHEFVGVEGLGHAAPTIILDENGEREFIIRLIVGRHVCMYQMGVGILEGHTSGYILAKVIDGNCKISLPQRFKWASGARLLLLESIRSHVIMFGADG